jgi:hypothetical protein
VRASHDDRQVAEAGPTPLWAAIEWAFPVWNDTGRPTWDRLDFTVTADGTHDVWIDDPETTHRWRLPERFERGRGQLRPASSSVMTSSAATASRACGSSSA